MGTVLVRIGILNGGNDHLLYRVVANFKGTEGVDVLPVGSKVLPYVPKVAYCKAVVLALYQTRSMA